MFEYKTQGVCSKKIKFKLVEGTVKDVLFVSGCDGNLKGIAKLVDGMKVEEVISKLEGIKCGQKNTSCPAQLADALKQYSQV
jgi:uncharacterized protein (TIGR03905 family)